MIQFHRKEQWDLERTPDVRPIICAHDHTEHASTRVFVLWVHGGMLKARWRGWGVHILPMFCRPSWRRYTYHGRRSEVESGTLRLGVAQVKWTRTIGRRGAP